MKKINWKSSKKYLIIGGAAVLTAAAALVIWLVAGKGVIKEVPTEETYSYINPDETKAQTDEGFTIDGVLDEAAYQNNNWLYLHNDDGGNNVDIAMTSFFGEKGMYFVYDVTESVPIYVNLSRASYMNSCIEMYFAPSSVTSLKENSYFEVDMLPTGDMVFKKSNGKGGYVNAATTDDIMAHLGATTKGGAVNTEDCYGYCLELFVPWEYMNWLGLDAEQIKNGFVYVDPAHITSHNLTGTDTNVDRYWYFYAQQQGAGFSDVYQYFRFDGTGVLGTAPVELVQGDNYTVTGDPSVIPGMQTTFTVTPAEGYAISSVQVNGQEMITGADFNEDGSVSLTVRGQKEGLSVCAAAEAVTDGSKSVTGKVVLNKTGGDTLEGVKLTYSGPRGQTTLDMNADGSFSLENQEQGLYVFTAEKEGYIPVSRQLLLNRDSYTELVLEYDMFFSEKGTCWVPDRQNEGVLEKFGGSGYVLTNGAYNSFTFEANLRYDEQLSEEADTDFFQQQRSGMRILFSNGKYWHIDMLKEDGKYILQYAKHSGDGSVFGWKTLCTLSSSQVAKYTSEEGIKLTVMRSGYSAGVWLDGKLLAVENLGSEYAGCTARLGFESWIANREIMQIPYSIQAGARKDVSNSPFSGSKEWDITGMYDGKLSVPGSDGDSGWINSYLDSYKELDITLNLRDQNTAAGNYRAAIAVTFDGGKNFIVTLTNAASNDDDPALYQFQTMPSSFTGWGTVPGFSLSAEQVAKLQSEDGLDVRLVRVGNTINVYADGTHVQEYVLTQTREGETVDVSGLGAKVQLRLYGNEGKNITLPFELKDSVDTVTVDVKGDAVVADRQTYLLGDTVTLSDSGAGDQICVGVKVDGVEAALDENGQYSFTAEKESYTVEGSQYAQRIFKDSARWNEAMQHEGRLSIPASDGDSGWIETYRADYTDVDLTLKLHDHDTDAANYRAAVRLAFSNGEYVTFTLTNDQTDEDAPDVYTLQNMGGSLQNWAQVKGFSLSAEQVQKLQNGTLELRVVRAGDIADIYVDGVHAYEFDLSVNKDGNASNIKELTTNVQLRFYGNTGYDVTVPFELKEQVDEVTVTVTPASNGTVTADQRNYLKGETVNLTVKGASGYYHTGVKANGNTVAVNANGKAGFTATESGYTVTAGFAAGVFADYSGNSWNLINQNVGMLHIPASSNGAGWMQTKSSFNELELTVKDYAKGSVHEYAAVGQLYFENGKYLTVRLIYWKDSDKYVLQSMGDSLYSWGVHYTLNTAQKAKVQGDGIVFRMERVGTVVNLYLDDSLVKTLDLTVKNSGITGTTGCVVKVRYYNSAGYDVTLPFALGNPAQTGTVTVTQPANGTIAVDKTSYTVGDTVTISVSGSSGWFYNDLKVNGKSVTVDWDGTYSFVATEKSYTVTGSFTKETFTRNNANSWNLVNQNVGKLQVNSHASGNSGWIDAAESSNDVTTVVKDYTPNAKNFSMIYHFTFSNGETFRLRLNHTDSDGKYRIQSMSSSTLFAHWKSPYTFTDAQTEKIKTDGIEFRVIILGSTAYVYLDGTQVCTFDLSSTGKDISGQSVKVSFRMDGNLNTDAPLSYILKQSEELP